MDTVKCDTESSQSMNKVEQVVSPTEPVDLDMLQ